MVTARQSLVSSYHSQAQDISPEDK